MELENYYLHAIACNDGKPFNDENALIKMEQILKSNNILSRRLQGDVDTSRGGWNGLDYISLCDYSRRNAKPYKNKAFYKGYTAFASYISSSVSLVLNKEGLEVVKTELLPPAVFDWDSLEEMRYLGNHPTKRFSDMPDEVQVMDSISLSRIEGITIPLAYMINDRYGEVHSREMIVSFLKDLKSILKSYDKSIPFYDLSSSILLEEDSDVDLALKANCK